MRKVLLHFTAAVLTVGHLQCNNCRDIHTVRTVRRDDKGGQNKNSFSPLDFTDAACYLDLSRLLLFEDKLQQNFYFVLFWEMN